MQLRERWGDLWRARGAELLSVFSLSRPGVLLIALFAGLATCNVQLLGATALDFENFADGTSLTTQVPNVVFSNAGILTAGLSLNEFEFPPHSGLNVVSDENGPLTIQFASPITTFSGYFTYVQRLTLTAYDSGGNSIAMVTSAFDDNEAFSGDIGSSPNELLHLIAAHIASVTIEGDPSGGSFVLDDVAIDSLLTVPEPVCWVTLSAALVFVFRYRKLK